MVANLKPTGRASSMPGGLIFGAAVSITITVIAAALLAWLINREVVSQSSIGYGIIGLLLMSSFTGSMASFARIKRQRMLVCLAAGGIYFGILLACTALFFGGQYSGVGVTALVVAAGALSAALLGLRAGKGRKNKKIKLPNR